MSPETAISGRTSLSLTWEVSLEGLCTKWATTDEGSAGEEDVNCLYEGTELDDG